MTQPGSARRESIPGVEDDLSPLGFGDIGLLRPVGLEFGALLTAKLTLNNRHRPLGLARNRRSGGELLACRGDKQTAHAVERFFLS